MTTPRRHPDEDGVTVVRAIAIPYAARREPDAAETTRWARLDDDSDGDDAATTTALTATTAAAIAAATGAGAALALVATPPPSPPPPPPLVSAYAPPKATRASARPRAMWAGRMAGPRNSGQLRTV
jgi:hypothetical protein